MPRKALILHANPRIKSIVENQLTKQRIDRSFYNCMEIINLAFKEIDNQDIRSVLNCSLTPVSEKEREEQMG